MKMKAPLASLLAASAFWGAAPVMALPPLDDFIREIDEDLYLAVLQAAKQAQSAV